MRWTIERPSPVPSVRFEKNGSTRRGRSLAGMPGPSPSLHRLHHCKAAPRHVGARHAIAILRRVGILQATTDVARLVTHARPPVLGECERRAMEKPRADGAVRVEEDLV